MPLFIPYITFRIIENKYWISCLATLLGKGENPKHSSRKKNRGRAEYVHIQAQALFSEENLRLQQRAAIISSRISIGKKSKDWGFKHRLMNI